VWEAVTAVALFVAVLLVFRGLLRGGVRQVHPDQSSHLTPVLSKDPGNRTLDTAYRLYHWSVELVFKFFPGQGWAGATKSAALVLALAVAARGWLSFRELHGPLSPSAAAAACFVLAVAMALPNGWRSPSDYLERLGPNVLWINFPSVYRGSVNPNVWHNPTTIFAAPFALLLFRQAFYYLEAPRLLTALAVGLSAVLCALAKPNYPLTFLPCFGVVLAVRAVREARRGRRAVWQTVAGALAAFAPLLVLLAWQFRHTFGTDTSIVFSPLASWSTAVDPPPPGAIHVRIQPWLLADRIPRAVLLGVAFPCAVAACYPRELRKDGRVLFGWLVLAAALAQYALLAQTGKQFISGNFFWALVPACYILFLESLRVIGKQPQGLRRGACLAVLVLHTASGLIYLVRALAEPVNSLIF
jgi:hypothetical protein